MEKRFKFRFALAIELAMRRCDEAMRQYAITLREFEPVDRDFRLHEKVTEHWATYVRQMDCRAAQGRSRIGPLIVYALDTYRQAKQKFVQVSAVREEKQKLMNCAAEALAKAKRELSRLEGYRDDEAAEFRLKQELDQMVEQEETSAAVRYLHSREKERNFE